LNPPTPKYNFSEIHLWGRKLLGERGFPDYPNKKIYNIQWSHSRDARQILILVFLPYCEREVVNTFGLTTLS
jgi:hypothetical protein